MEITPQNDHDNITRLVVDVKNLKDGQDKFHREMKEIIDDLKNNLVARVEKLENWQNYILGICVVASGVIIFLGYQLFEHLKGIQ